MFINNSNLYDWCSKTHSNITPTRQESRKSHDSAVKCNSLTRHESCRLCDGANSTGHTSIFDVYRPSFHLAVTLILLIMTNRQFIRVYSNIDNFYFSQVGGEGVQPEYFASVLHNSAYIINYDSRHY